MTHRSLKATAAALLTLAIAATGESVAAAEIPQSARLPMAPAVDLTVTAPDEIVRGTRLYITVKAADTIAATGTLEWSYDQEDWNTTSIKIPITDGQGAVSWAPTEDKWYRIGGGDVVSDPWHTEVNAQDGYAISAGTRSAQAHYMESVYLVGSAIRNGKGGAYRVKVEYQTSDGWGTIDTIKASSTGSFKMRVRPTADRTFRAKILSSSGDTLATSEPFFVDYTSGYTTLEERRANLAWRLGSATTGVNSISSYDVSQAKYTGGATAARYQKFKNGMLVEVTASSGSVRTWALEGRHYAGYRDRGAWNGKLGLPERDTRCRLLEGGCVTLFSGGALYTNSSSMSKGIYAAYGRTQQVEILAAAFSQRNYEEPSWRESKYNEWIGGTNAWCQVFVAWSTYASGHYGEAPVNTYFPSYLATAKQSPALNRDPKGSEIRAGDVLIFDWGTGDPTHTGFAVSVSGSWVYTLEGNTTDGTNDPQRGVYYRKRPLSGVWASFHPNEYKEQS